MSSTKTFVSLKQKYDRIVILVDMDCFYCQVEEQLDSKLAGKPIAVVQYLENAGIIAVNYTARAKGVTRHMREKEAKAACPELICVKVPCLRGKADLTKYRDAGLEVAKVLQTFTTLLERASVDEAYLDITESVLKRCTEMNEGKYTFKPEQFVNNHAVGFENFGNFIQNVTESVGVNNDRISEEDKAAYSMSKLKLLIGASIVTEIRQAVRDKTGYTCSAGIAHNKILAKFTAGLNKPNKQTILPIDSISGLFMDLPISKVKSLGGKLGEEICTSLSIKTMNDLLAFSEIELKQRFEERVGSWLFLMARGIDLEQVTPKFNAKSISCSKRFAGKNAITSIHTLNHWLKELSQEIIERLEKDSLENDRTSRHMTVSFTQQIGKKDVASSRNCPLNGSTVNAFDIDRMTKETFDTIKRSTDKFLKAEGMVIMMNPIKFLGITAGKFENNDATSGSVQSMFKNHNKKPLSVNTSNTSPKSSDSISNVPSSVHDSLKKYQVPKKDKMMSTFLSPKRNISGNADESFENCKEDTPEKVIPDTMKKEYDTNEENPHDLNNSKISHGKEKECSEDTKQSLIPINESIELIETLEEDIELVSENIDQPTSEEYETLDDFISDMAASMDVEQPVKDFEKISNCATEELTVEPQNTTTPEETPCSSSSLLYNDKKSDYTETYAEFYKPVTIEDLIAHETCTECGKSIPLIHMTSHVDHHFALQLSQQFRTEFREQLKSRPVTTQPTTSKATSTKSKIPTVLKPPTNSIHKYTIKENLDSKESDDVNKIKCEKCSKYIDNIKYAEHLDYHYAQSLRTLDREPAAITKPSENGKRKKPASKKDAPKMKSLKSFFN
ncbi:unnamed protein product [Diamesa serratosioi]